MNVFNRRGGFGLRALGIPGFLGLTLLASTVLSGTPGPYDVHLVAVETEGPQELDADSVSPGRVSPVGVSENSFNSVESGFGFSIDRARFDTRPSQISVFHNSRLVPDDELTASDSLIELPPILQSGRNVVEVLGADSEGRMLDTRFVFWAGSHRLQGVVVDREGTPVPNSKLTVILIEAPGVTARTRSDASGSFELEHLPPNVVHIEGHAEPELFGSLPARGDAGSVRLVLFGIDPPAEVNREGWRAQRR